MEHRGLVVELGPLRLSALLCAALVWGCEVPPDNRLTPSGLWDGSPLAAPQGALLVADNVALRKPGVLESFPGRQYLGGSFPDGFPAERVTFYQSLFILARSNGKLTRHDGVSTYTDFSGTYLKPDSTNKVRFAQAGGLLYFTTSLGMRSLDGPTGTPLAAGLAKPTHTQQVGTQLQDTGGFLPDGYQVAYRATLCYRTSGGRVIEGEPSPRVLIYNATDRTGLGNNYSAAVARNTQPYLSLPSGVTTSHFIRLYRTASIVVATDPGEEMGLIYEHVLTSAEVSALRVGIPDVVPDAVRGATGYFCPSQQGILASHTPPPLARDVAPFRSSLLFANTTSPHTVALALIAVGGTVGLTAGDSFYVGGSAYTAVSDATQLGSVTGGFFIPNAIGLTQAQLIEATARNLVDVINLTHATVSADYTSGETDFPGRIALREKGVGGNAFSVAVGGASFASTLYSGSFTRAANVVTVTFSAPTPHVYVVGQVVDVQPTGSTDPSFAAGQKTLTGVTGTTFTYAETGSNGTNTQPLTFARVTQGAAWRPVPGNYPSSTVTSDNDRRKNRLFWSLDGLPEAVPLLNNKEIGSQDAAILRILPLNNTTLIFKEDGLWRLTGKTATSFVIEPLDPTLILAAPDTLVAFENRALGVFNKGVLAVSESGAIEPIGFTRIDETAKGLLLTALTQLQAYAFGLANEAQREYELHLPLNSASTADSQAFVYNAKTDAWSRKYQVSKACGVASPAAGLLYYGDVSASASLERSTGTSADYQAEDGTPIVEAFTFAPFTAGAPSVPKEFQTVWMLFAGALPTSGILAAATPEGGAASPISLTLTNGTSPGFVPAQLPAAQRVGRYLTLGFSHSAAQEQLQCLGAIVDFKPLPGGGLR